MRLTKNEQKRACASGKVTVAVRPQAGGRGYAVNIVGGSGRVIASRTVKTRSEVGKAVKAELDMLDRLGADCDMAYDSSHRKRNR